MQQFMIFTAKYLYLIIAGLSAGYWLTLTKRLRIRFAVYFALAGIIAIILTKVGGVLYFDPRPFVVHHVAPLIPHVPDNGFPSDHTVLSTLFALTVFRFSRKGGLALAILALLVGVSRVYVRVHSPIDIVGGVLIAALAMLCGALILKRAFLPSAGHTDDVKTDVATR